MCSALRKTTRAVTRLYEDVMDGADMSVLQFSVLRHLADHGDLPLSRLAALLVMDRTTLYRTLGPITREGWAKVADGKGRAKIASITPEGMAAMEASTAAWVRAQDKLLMLMGAQKWGILQGALTDLSTRIADSEE